MMLDDFKRQVGNVDDDTATFYIDKAIKKFKNHCHRQDVPEDAESSIADYAVVRYNRQGSEGLQSESYSGVNNTYEKGIPEEIRKEWDSFKKVRTL